MIQIHILNDNKFRSKSVGFFVDRYGSALFAKVEHIYVEQDQS